MGLRTACIENRNLLGGTCLNVGCIPSKTLLNVTHKYHAAKHNFARMGLQISNIDINWPQVQKERASTIEGLAGGITSLFRKYKVDWLKGYGKILGKNSVNIKLNMGGEQQITAKNIIIATGSEVAKFPGVEFDEKVIVSSTGALESKKIPKTFITIGAGVIGLELGSVYNSIGTRVKAIEFSKHICPFTDKEV